MFARLAKWYSVSLVILCDEKIGGSIPPLGISVLFARQQDVDGRYLLLHMDEGLR